MAQAQGVSSIAAEFNAGILTAMAVGLSPNTGEQPIFVFADEVTNVSPADEEEVPFDPSAIPTRVEGNRILNVPCAIEFMDAAGRLVDLGIISPTKVRLTLLDAQYRLVHGFDHVLIAGDRYNYRLTEPPLGLVDAQVWVVHCTAEDDT